MNYLQNEEFIYVELSTKKGTKYHVGYPKSSGYTIENLSVYGEKLIMQSTINLDLTANKCEVDWKLNTPCVITPCAKAKGIKDAAITKSSPLQTGTYTLTFTNTSGWYFYFDDNCGEQYFISTPRNGVHTLGIECDTIIAVW